MRWPERQQTSSQVRVCLRPIIYSRPHAAAAPRTPPHPNYPTPKQALASTPPATSRRTHNPPCIMAVLQATMTPAALGASRSTVRQHAPLPVCLCCDKLAPGCRMPLMQLSFTWDPAVPRHTTQATLSRRSCFVHSSLCPSRPRPAAQQLFTAVSYCLMCICALSGATQRSLAWPSG